MSDEALTTGPAAADVNGDGGASSQPQPERVEATKSKGSKLSAREDVQAAFDELSREPAKDEVKPKAEAPKPDAAKETKTEGAAPARGPDGKFAKGDQHQAPDAKTAEAAGAVQQPQPVNAPALWKGSQKVDWNRLPRPVQEGIAAEFERYSAIEQQFAPINAVLGPRAATLTAQYGSPDKALQQLFALSDFADQNPVGFLNWFAQQRRINLQQPANHGQQAGQQFQGQPDPASQANIDPALKPFVDELNGIKRYLSQQQQQMTAAEAAAHTELTQKSSAEVQAFVANSAKYPYANDLRTEMSEIFLRGEAKTLDEAYEKATWRNPAVRDRMIADRTQKEIERQAAAAAEKKNAGVSVHGSPGGQGLSGSRKATVRDDVLAAAKEIGFGGSSRL